MWKSYADIKLYLSNVRCHMSPDLLCSSVAISSGDGIKIAILSHALMWVEAFDCGKVCPAVWETVYCLKSVLLDTLIKER